MQVGGGERGSSSAVFSLLSRTSCMDLTKRREPGPYFFLSLTPQPISDSMQPYLGLYHMPTLAFYGSTFPQGDLKAIVRTLLGPTDLPRIPAEISSELLLRGIDSLEVFWVASDIGHVLAVSPERNINVINHSWIFADATPMARSSGVFDMGVYIYPHSNVLPRSPKPCMAVNTMSKMRISVHSQKGGMCCSPNNARIEIAPSISSSTPMSYFWTVVIDHRQPNRACVSLQWAFHTTLADKFMIFSEAQTLGDLLPRLSQEFGPEHPAVLDVLRLFGGASPCPPRAPMEGPPIRKDDESFTKPKGQGRGSGRGQTGAAADVSLHRFIMTQSINFKIINLKSLFVSGLRRRRRWRWWR